MTNSVGMFEQAVGAVLFDADGRVLLIRRGRPPRYGMWSLPGGRVLAGESPTAAIEREVLEETGLRVRAELRVETVVVEEEGFAYEVEDYLCVLVEPGEPRAADDALDARWASLGELAALGVLAAVVRVVERAATLRDR